MQYLPFTTFLVVIGQALSASVEGQRQRVLSSSSRCKDGKKYLMIKLQTDNYGFENSWTLSKKNENGKLVPIKSGPPGISNYADNQKYHGGYCLSPGTYEFVIRDKYLDGMCCTFGKGFYVGSVDGVEKFSSPKGNGDWGERKHTFLIAGSTDSESTKIDEYDAVIVGAGWAGLKAAKTLVDYGITSILVLEANNFVGGRSRSVNSDGSINVPPNKMSPNNVPTEWGSEWLYLDDNDMEPYLRRNGLIGRALNYADKETVTPGLSHDESQFYLQSKKGDGTITTKVLSEDDADDFEDGVWNGFLEFREDLLDRLGGGDISYKAALRQYIQEEDIVDNEERQYLNMAVGTAGEMDHVGDANFLSLKNIELFDGDVDQTHYTSVEGAGYGNIAASYVSSFQSKINLKLNAKVTEIRQGDGSESNTISYVENGGLRKVTAKTVLVTVSLGVLKAGTIAFTPNGLPQYKQEVIDGMGFGVMNKCAMFWNDAADIVWPDKVWFHLITNDAASSNEWTSFMNPTRFKKTPVLVGFIGGNEAIAAEQKSDKEILDANMKHLKMMFPGITRPNKVIITRWSQDEFVRGSYSFPKVGRNHDNDAYRLQQRFGRIWFAGEATTSSWYGSTIGAWETGEKAARSMVSTLESG